MTEIILKLLKKELFNGENSDLNGVDWNELWKEAQLQSVTTLIYAGADKMGQADGSLKGAAALQLLKNSNSFMNHVKIGNFLDEAKIPYMIIKGVISASYYPDPYVRPMGDTDVLVKKEDFEKAKQLFIEKGLETDKQEVTMDSQHHHIDFRFNKQRVELHYEIPGIPNNDMAVEVVKMTEDIWDNIREYDTIYGKIKGASPFYHGLIMLLHMQGHMQKGGMGLRHLCDWAMFVNSFSADDFNALFKDKLTELGLWRFACLLSQTSAFLGLPEKDWMGKDEEIAQMLLDDIISCGNFGRKDSLRVQSQKYVPVVGNPKKKKSQLGQYIDYGLKTTCVIWPFYKKHKWLLPIGFIAYCVRTVFRLITKKSKMYDLKDNNKIYDLYSQLKLFEK